MIKWVIVFIPFIALADAAPSALKARFLATVPLKEGIYQLVEGSEDCLEGPLKILDQGQELTIMLGANPLLMGLGQTNEKITEGDCEYTFAGSFTSTQLIASKTGKCKDRPAFSTKVQVDLGEGQFIYHRKQTVAGKVQKQNCTLRLSVGVER